nr:DoxX family protein [uncultured Fluviicola sp.]
MKGVKITFWVSTGLIGLFIIPGVFFLNTPFAKEVPNHLGLPTWFQWELGILKAIGALVLLLPFVGNRIKEWAYFGLFLDVLSASFALTWVDGLKGPSFFPLVIFAILAVSYWSHHKLHKVF